MDVTSKGAVRETAPLTITSRLLDFHARPASYLCWRDATIIGRGAFGTVYRLECHGIGTVAAKHFAMPSPRQQDATRARLKKEARVLMAARHPNIVHILGVSLDDPDRWCVLLEYAALGSLRDYLDAADEPLPEVQLSLACDVARGMAYLHAHKPKPILHHDLKSSNVLIFGGTCAKLTDFGLASHTGLSSLGASSVGGNAGTFQYHAPEVFDDKPFTAACDVYAFGVLVWEICTRRTPWAGKSQISVGRMLDKGDRPDSLPGCEVELTHPLRAIAHRAWAQSPCSRPTFAELEAGLRALPPPTSCDLLIFACTPSVSPLANALPEARAVEARCTGWACNLISANATANELRRQLCKLQPRRFLFSGHGDAADPTARGTHTLGFTGPGGIFELVRADHLRTLLGAHGVDSGGRLQLCFLNGCCTETLGRAAREAGVPTVVCWRTESLDGAARLFSTVFFETTVLGRSYRESFDEAIKAVRLATSFDPTSGHNLPAYELRGPTPAEMRPGGARRPYPAGVPVLIDAAGTRCAVDVP